MAEGSPSDHVGEEARRIYLQLKDLSLAEREFRLAEACGGDPALQDAVVRLLLEEDDYDWLFQPGDLILGGRYEVIRPVGRGGLGEVYLAIRLDDEERRTDAIKVLRGGDYDGLARAEREGLRLKDLKHEFIPQYRDHGTLPAGQPYLAMEYVHGLPIGTFCEKNSLSLRERLRLFLQVCSAVSFLHQQRLLHRDLKPSNILVTSAGAPKVLDFNISKRLPKDGVADQTLTAGRVLPPFTANYASPEQIIGRYLGQSSDVYSLGVVLYELLTGEVPVDLEHLIEEPETLRQAAEDSTIQAPSAIALERLLDRDLDIVTMKALEKETKERYQAVDDLAEDVRRFLAQRPVLAKRPSVAYRARKFIARNRMPVAFAAVLFLVIGGAAFALYQQYLDTVEERDRVEQERDRAELLISFLERVFEDSNPYTDLSDRASAEQLLEKGAVEAREDTSLSPDVRGNLFYTLARIQLRRGNYGEAEELIREALPLIVDGFGENSDHYSAALNSSAIIHQHLGNFRGAEGLYRESLKVLGALPKDSDTVRSEAYTLQNLGRVLVTLERVDEARDIYQKSWEVFVDNDLEEDPIFGQLLGKIAHIRRLSGDVEGAEQMYLESIAHRAHSSGENSPEVAVTLNDLGDLYRTTDRAQEAIGTFERAIRIYEGSLGPEHPFISISLSNLSLALRDSGNFAGALEKTDRALEIAKKAYGADHPQISIFLLNRAFLLLKLKELKEAKKVAQDSLSGLKRHFGDTHGRTAQGHGVVGMAHTELGEFEEAELHLITSQELLATPNGCEDRKNRKAHENLLALYEAWGREEQAREIASRCPNMESN